MRPAPASAAQLRAAKLLHERIDRMTQADADDVRNAIRSAYKAGLLTNRQINTVCDKFNYIRHLRTINVEKP